MGYHRIRDFTAAREVMAGGDQTALSERLLEVINTQTEIARLGLDLGGVMDLVALRAQALTGAVGAVVELAEGEEMVYRAAAGIAQPHLGLRLRRDNSISGLCVREGQPLRCDDSETDARVDREACRRVGLRSMVVVPLRHNDTVVGALKVLARDPAAFSDGDLRVLGLMSDLIAAAMFHATRYGSDELFFRATHDGLTGLANRALFYDRLRHCLAQAQREAQRVAVLNLDMDGLKPINDSYGHRVGDAALKELAGRLRQESRAADTVARLGGDEFGVILPHVEDGLGPRQQAQRLSDNIGRPFSFEERDIPLAASIGYALFPDDSGNLEGLLEHADRAMYASKRARKNAAPG